MDGMNRPQRRSGWRRFGAALLAAAAAALASAAVAVQFADAGWVFDAATHFRWQYLVAATVVAGAALLCRRPWLGLVAALAGAVHVPAILGGADRLARAADGEKISLAISTANVSWRNEKIDGLLGRLKVADSDIVVLQEVRGHWHRAVESLLARYPHVAPENWRAGAIVILSRHPIVGSRATHDTVTAEIDFKGRRIRVAGVHAPTPLATDRWRAQDDLLARLAAAARADPVPYVAAGDFNLTPYSPRFRRFLAASGLRRTAESGIWPATWPTAGALRYAGPLWRGIEIDHVLASDHFRLIGSYRGGDIGSDHFPVHTLLWLPR